MTFANSNVSTSCEYGMKRAATVACAVACLALLSACDQTGGSKPVGQADTSPGGSSAVTLNIKSGAQTSVEGANNAIRDAGQNLATAGREASAALGEKVDDMTITASVSARLAQDPELSATRINVDTRNGGVTLRGPAPSQAARDKASTIVNTVPGVVSVDNQLVVQAG